MSRCLHCSRDGATPAPGSRYCEECRQALIRSGMVDLLLPGETIDQAGRFVGYVELKAAERARGVDARD